MKNWKHSIVAVIAALTLIFLHSCATTGSGTGLSLYDAIGQTGEKIADELPKGSRVAIVAFESVNDNLSDYIMEELTGELFDRGIEVADRQNLEYVYKELNLQMSGDVSDESAKSIGKFLAADMVITGQLIDLDGTYRYRTSAINVETAVRASVTRLDVRSDAATRRMITALANQQTTVKTAKYGVSADVTPQTAGTFLDRGIMFYLKGENGMAIADLTEAIRLNPNMGQAYYQRGMVYLKTGDDDRAIADFTQAIRLDPSSHFLAYLSRGNVYLNHVNGSDYDRAIADFNQAIQINPNIADTYYYRGLAYAGKNNLDSAIADFNQAIRLNPNYAGAYGDRADAYFRKGNLDSAIADFNEAIRLNPNHANNYFRRGFIYFRRGDNTRAIADLEAALRIDPNHADARNGLEVIRQQQNR